jgi:hypothetical protein
VCPNPASWALFFTDWLATCTFLLAFTLSTLSTASASPCRSHVFCHLRMTFVRDARPALTPMRVLCSGLHRLLGCLAHVYFSHSPTPLLSSANHPHTRPNIGAQINAPRAQPDVQPDANAPDTKVRHRAPTRAVPPSSPIMRKPLQLAVAPQAPPLRLAAVPAVWVSVDLRGVGWRVFSWPPGRVLVLQSSVSVSCAKHGVFVWCACSGTSRPKWRVTLNYGPLTVLVILNLRNLLE